ncbi:MAG TPA: hypothetical protein VKP65_17740 [Rhodothermales bacterium]|nr:hypothetical protein [Rhodothermales bacterium]
MSLQPYLDADDAELAVRWSSLEQWLTARFGKTPDIESILFLIGIQARGRGFEPELEKDAKQSLIMEGTYHAFAALGIYERIGMEADGHWIWERVIDHPPDLSVEAQEKLLKIAILQYFEESLDVTEADEK